MDGVDTPIQEGLSRQAQNQNALNVQNLSLMFSHGLALEPNHPACLAKLLMYHLLGANNGAER